MENKSDRKIIPEENRPDLIENLRKTRLLIRETQMTAQSLVNSDELWRSLRKDFIDSQNNAEKIFQDIYIDIDKWSKIGDNVKNIISYFKIGKVKNKITEGGYGFISRSVKKDRNVYFHLTALRGMKFEDIENDLNVLFIEKEKRKGYGSYASFSKF